MVRESIQGVVHYPTQLMRDNHFHKYSSPFWIAIIPTSILHLIQKAVTPFKPTRHGRADAIAADTELLAIGSLWKRALITFATCVPTVVRAVDRVAALNFIATGLVSVVGLVGAAEGAGGQMFRAIIGYSRALFFVIALGVGDADAFVELKGTTGTHVDVIVGGDVAADYARLGAAPELTYGLGGVVSGLLVVVPSSSLSLSGLETRL